MQGGRPDGPASFSFGRAVGSYLRSRCHPRSSSGCYAALFVVISAMGTNPPQQSSSSRNVPAVPSSQYWPAVAESR